MHQKERTKFGFFRQIGTAIARPGRYDRFFGLKLIRVVIFIFLFILLTTFCSYFLPFIAGQITGNSYRDIIDEYVPEFRLENGILSLEETVRYDDGRMLVIADSAIDAFESGDLDAYGDYAAVYLISSSNLIVREGNQTVEYALADFKDISNKEELYSYLPSMYMMIGLSGLMAYMSNLSNYCMGALLLTILGKLLQTLLHSRFGYLQLFQLAVYSKVTYEVVAAAFGMFGFTVPYGLIVGAVIAIIYLVYVMRYLTKNGYEESAPAPKKAKEEAVKERAVTPLMAYRDYRSNPDLEEEEKDRDN